jgi:hypothetical protein
MGSLEDVILDPENLTATHIILGGGFFEEYMESSGQIDDIDELAPLDIIDKIDNDYIVLTKQLEELETTDKEGNLPVNGFKYSDFVKLPLSDLSGEVDGEIFDYIFNYDDSYVVLIHQGVGSALMADQFYQKIELEIHIRHFSVKDGKIKLAKDPESMVAEVKQQVQPKSMGKSRVVIN